MVRCKSTTRFLSISKDIILTQTDTTVGFISKNHTRLSEIKSRPISKPFIKIYNSFLACESRIPNTKKSFVRRSKKTTFIIKNRAFRINSHLNHSQILRDLDWHYSTSANEANKNFNREFCELKADIIIEDKNGLRELTSSQLIKLNNYKTRKLR